MVEHSPKILASEEKASTTIAIAKIIESILLLVMSLVKRDNHIF